VEVHLSQVYSKINWRSPECAYLLNIKGVTAHSDGQGTFSGFPTEAILQKFIKTSTRSGPAIENNVRNSIAMRRAQFDGHVDVVVMIEINGQTQFIVTGLAENRRNSFQFIPVHLFDIFIVFTSTRPPPNSQQNPLARHHQPEPCIANPLSTHVTSSQNGLGVRV
jgi:hypothetical protein